MKNILCYGDSNTWGFIPGSINFKTMFMKRYPRHVRWTGVLQHDLRRDYYVIEEGLNGRTTNIDYQEFSGRNGKTFLPICLYSHSPLDLIVLMLGSNDLKQEFNRQVIDIANGIEELINIINNSKNGTDMQSPPKILLVSPPVLANETYDGEMFKNGIARSMQLGAAYKQIAQKHHCDFIDSAPHIKLSEIDGLHFDEQAHTVFANLISREIKNIL